MKATHSIHQIFSRSIAPVAARPIRVGISAVVLFVLVGCATQKPAGVTHAGAPISETLRLEPGTIGVVTPGAPARFSFDQALGQIESANDRAGNFARETLGTATGPDPLAAAAIAFA